MLLHQLPTPAGVIDAERLRANAQALPARLAAHGVRLRPHVKTPKCLEVARLQREAGAAGITVSTLREAEAFFADGWRDILYAVGMVPAKLPRVLVLRQAGCDLKVIVDSVAAARAVAEASRSAQAPIPALIEIDTDQHRAGVAPEAAELIDVGRALHEGGAVLHGVMTHHGGSYAESTPEGLAAAAERERSRCVRAAERLRVAGLPCPVVSVGSTPTAWGAGQWTGVHEVRAGVYIFNDLVMCNIGVARPEQVAFSVLASVIGHQADKGWVLVDAGWMALSRDRGTQSQAVDHGYGAVCDAAGQLLPGWAVTAANQEHGTITCAGADAGPHGPALLERFPLGSLLRILPNHACATAAQFDRYAVLHGQDVQATWSRIHGW
jgi:threo-3-hydroxy-D-aspartate ammonia-lyase